MVKARPLTADGYHYAWDWEDLRFVCLRSCLVD